MAIRRAVTALVLVLATALVAVVAQPEPAGGQTPARYVPPVDAPVVDPFRPPASAFGAGNRGLTYDLPSGTPVRASADGHVTYAGTVAGTLHVTVLHPDGLRTSY
jgi:murein DD-endopeptidase MepM/ murein hydrolase activator NlpD